MRRLLMERDGARARLGLPAVDTFESRAARDPNLQLLDLLTAALNGAANVWVEEFMVEVGAEREAAGGGAPS